MYFNARYYDPELGQFLSPDTLVPDPGNLFDYNRYMYVRGNPMMYNDPTGRSSCMAIAPAHPILAVARLGCQVGEMAMQYGPTAVQLAVQWADKLPAVDWLFSSAEQGGHSAGQQNAGNTADPGGLDPNKLPKGFENVAKFREFGSTVNNGLAKAGYGDTQAIFQGSSVTGVKYTTGQPFDVGRLSDYDIALAGEKLMKAAQQIGVGLRQGGIRTEPLQDWQLAKLGLDGLAKQLSELAGRPVNFMIYQSVEAATKRAPSILIPK
jgi:uncharacterized protein RhaS with RHS repeats